MTALFDKIKALAMSVTLDQWIALGICIIALSLIKEFVKSGLSIVIGCIAALAALYFIAPELYYTVFSWIQNAWGTFKSLLS